MNILIVEDESVIAEGLKFNFEQEGYTPFVAGDGQTALDILRDPQNSIDVILLDLMLPGMSGYDVCKEIRELDPQVPVLVLSARTLSEDKTQAFDLGADQYMTKPFALPELLSRVRNLVGRRPKSDPGLKPHGRSETVKLLPDQYELGKSIIDFSKFQIHHEGEVESLTTMEIQLLKYFIQNEDRVLSRTQILEDVWNQNAEISTRTIDNFVLRLRKMIEENPANPQHIVSVRGTGYQFFKTPK
ncbi:Sensory transduction protein regX3 [Polystyrenella longa]|uniref:Sensory transduction protein regX3 n=1 Tax=Polystyrenella longa TaxID=2528007 RepID=A0A518CIN7_9PLAN|nr:response regulator transcription factor [Polystyrenella longa]QDU79099.1 Sensory transduction protein regX3 [Polystyrenella longa]